MGFTRRPAFTSGPVRSKAPVLSRFVAANAPLVVTALLVAGVLCLGWRPLVHSSGAPVDSSTLQRQHAGAGSAGAAGKQWGGGRRSAAETATDAAAQQAATHAAVAEAAVAAQVSADPAAAMQAAVAAVNASSEVHGFVSKQGPADPRNWHPNYKAYREARLAAWLKEREQLLAEGRLPPPMPVYMGCQVYVNHLYKVIYLRHAKTASSSLFCHFGGCRDNATDSDAARLRFEPLQVNSTQAMEALWRDYLVVTFVRNPYQRAVSSYRMMMRQLAAGGPVAPAYSWGAFCADPTGFADQCMRDEFCSKRGRNFVYVHIQPQQPCIVTADGGWAVDFVGRVERIDEDLAAVLAELERRRPADAPPVKPLEGSLMNVNGRGCNESLPDNGHSVAQEQYCEPAQYYGGAHAACFAQVRHHYYTDAHGLQFGPAELERGDAAAVARRRRQAAKA